MSSDARTAYVFQCGNEDLFSVSHDRAGARSGARFYRAGTYHPCHSLPVDGASSQLLNQSFLGVDW
jgi:hypothetical protein